MHYWGDDWFKENGESLYKAINYIETNLHKYGIHVYGKEKYGTYRDEYLRFWDGSLYFMLFGPRLAIGPMKFTGIKWLDRLRGKIHEYIYWRIDNGYTWEMLRNPGDYELIKQRFTGENGEWVNRGLKHWVSSTKFYARYIERKKDAYNRVFQEACKLWPNLETELIVDLDGWEMIVPGKWGDVSGKEIHDYFWAKPETKEEDK